MKHIKNYYYLKLQKVTLRAHQLTLVWLHNSDNSTLNWLKTDRDVMMICEDFIFFSPKTKKRNLGKKTKTKT